MLVREFHREIWWPRCEATLREITLESYRCIWKNWISPAFGDKELCEITPRSLDAWLEREQVTQNAWRVCKALIRCAYKYEYIETDPTSRVLNVPKRGTPDKKTLTRGEMVRLMDGLKDTPPLYLPVVCSCTMGLRREEACGLMWEDFDWEKKVVHITRGVQFVNGREIEVEPKTKLSKRVLPLPEETISRLLPHRATGRISAPYHVHQTATRLKAICEKRGLPYVPMSNLRNSWCTLMVNENKPVSKVSRYMGHADVQTTMRWYTRAREDELFEISDSWKSKDYSGHAGNATDEQKVPHDKVTVKNTRSNKDEIIRKTPTIHIDERKPLLSLLDKMLHLV